MEKCPHARQMSICSRTQLLNPRNWSCSECGTTESVWACLTCSHFACGRSSSGHAIKHFHLTRHPLAIEVNEKYVHCYLCDDWVLNDTLTNDIQLVQSLLQQVAAQNYIESRTRSGRVIRPAALFTRMESRIEEAQSRTADKRYTALCHWKYTLLSKTFNSWKDFVKSTTTTNCPMDISVSASTQSTTTNNQRKQMITPGMTGLRNLGNTCYMNAALQVLGHLHFLRETFKQMGGDANPQANNSSILFNRQTTVECFQHISTKQSNKYSYRNMIKRHTAVGNGLVGGEGGLKHRELVCTNEEASSLCEEIHRLMRVMWSGKWAVITPHTILNAIWHHIPTFRGYCQQDAQEFLCELLDRLQSELLQCPSELTITIEHPSRDVVPAREILRSLFEGQLTSIISYSRCRHNSVVTEPFWDLSLEFPTALSSLETAAFIGSRRSFSIPTNLTDMLTAFTSTEHISEQSFTCSQCSVQNQSITKRLSISLPPEVLRLHLKRFRFTGKTWQKITSTISFPLELSIYQYSTNHTHSIDPATTVGVVNTPEDYVYDLAGVIVHHGTGFACGHYTAYCWNNHAGAWVHCNDARIARCSSEDVLKAQAYVLFYARRNGRSPVLHDSDIRDQPPLKIRKIN